MLATRAPEALNFSAAPQSPSTVFVPETDLEESSSDADDDADPQNEEKQRLLRPYSADIFPTYKLEDFHTAAPMVFPNYPLLDLRMRYADWYMLGVAIKTFLHKVHSLYE